MRLLCRFIVVLLPLLYVWLIWLQSSRFNPSEVVLHFGKLPLEVLVVVGVIFELAHLIEFGILYLLIIVAFLPFGKLNSKKEKTAFVISLTYSLVDEIHQYFVPFRSFSMVDIVKNIIGITIMWYLVRRSYFTTKQNKLGSLLKGFTNFSR